MKTNKNKVVAQAVIGEIRQPVFRPSITTEGKRVLLPSIGSITYGVHAGDPCFGLAVDHLEPSISIRHSDNNTNLALMAYSCPGNKATVVSGDAKGATGYVIGTHGGINDTIIEFSEADMSKMVIGDKIQIKGYGQGLQLLDHPDIEVISMDPDLLDKLDIEEKDGYLYFPVTTVVPGAIMGSGVGSGANYTGDYDIITQDEAIIKKNNIDKLRFGDFVLLEDSDNSFGLGSYVTGASSIGIVVHSDCVLAGHGPGVTIMLTSKKGKIKPKIDPTANISKYMK